MANLLDTAKAYSKKDITSLDVIDLKETEIMTSTFGEGENKREWRYFEIDGWKYSINAAVLSAIKDLLEMRPQTTKIKVYRDKQGDLKVMPID